MDNNKTALMLSQAIPMGEHDNPHGEWIRVRLDVVLDAIEQLKDAARYRWLMERMQEVYDGANYDIGHVDISCMMIFGRKEVRRVSAEISWFDERDEDLNLSSAIDRELQQPTTKD
jgi:hypothetical protein